MEERGLCAISQQFLQSMCQCVSYTCMSCRGIKQLYRLDWLYRLDTGYQIVKLAINMYCGTIAHETFVELGVLLGNVVYVFLFLPVSEQVACLSTSTWGRSWPSSMLSRRSTPVGTCCGPHGSPTIYSGLPHRTASRPPNGVSWISGIRVGL